MGCTLSKVVSPQSVLDTNVTRSTTKQRRWYKRKSRKVAAVVEKEITGDKVDSHGVVSDIDAEYGIYNDDGGVDLDDFDMNSLTNDRLIRVRPMAAKGERTVNEKSQMSFHMGDISQDVEELISVLSTVNHRDKRFRPKAAKGINTPSWSTAVGVSECRRQAIAERSVAMFQANSCVDSWMQRQMERERRQTRNEQQPPSLEKSDVPLLPTPHLLDT